MPDSPAEKGRKLFEKEEAEEQKIVKRFDPRMLVKDSSKVHKILDKVEGEILYYPLLFEDMEEIRNAPSDEERTRVILFKLLSRAYPGLTLEDIRNFPLMKATHLLEIIGKAEGFYGENGLFFQETKK
jgi:hypothetical protein